MSVRRILAKTINTGLEYEAIGIDLAKNCVSVALLTTDGEVVCIDRLDYSELEKSAQVLCPTTFAMEPCTEMNYLVQKLEAWGHRCLVVQSINTLSIKQMRTQCLQASISSGRSPVPHSLA